MAASGRFALLHPLPSPATMLSAALLLAAFFPALHYAEPRPLPLAAGLALVVLGVLIRVATNGVLKKNEAAFRDGPYALCRHPMYAGTITLAAGIAVALNHLPALAVPAAAIAISLWRIRKEEAFLGARFPDYAAYRREVPAFPTPGSLARAAAAGRLRFAFSLRQCFLNGEMLRLNLYLPLLLACGFYLERLGRLALPTATLAAGGGLSLALAAVSLRLHPPESSRSRLDYLLPAALGLGLLALALHG